MAKVPAQSCIEIAIEASHGVINREEAIKAFDMAAKIKLNLLEGPFKSNMNKRVAAEVGKLAAEAKLSALVNKQTYMRNVIVFRNFMSYIDSMDPEGKNYHGTVDSYLHGTVKNKKEGLVSVESTRHAYEAEMYGVMFDKLVASNKTHLTKLFGNEKFDADVAHELHAPGSTKNLDAKFLAEIFAERMEWSRVKRNSLGAHIQKAAGYAGPQIDNDIKMLKNGKEAWITFVYDRLDLKKTFPHLDPKKDIDEIKSILGDSFNTIVSGSTRSTSQVNFGVEASIKNYNLATNMSKVRFKHFKSAQDSIDYQKEYGAGSTISGILESFRNDARDMSIMDKLSNNPSAMMDRVLGELTARLVAKGASKDTVNTLKSGAMKSALDIATGESSFISNHTAAWVGGEVRALSTMALLGKAVLAAIPSDTVTVAAASMFRGNGYINGMRQVLFAKMDGLTKQERLEFAYLHGEAFDGIIGQLSRAALAEDTRIGFFAKHLDTYFKFNGLGPWTNTVRGIATRVITSQVGYNSGKQFADLHWKFQNALAQSGIDAGAWNAIRHAVTEASNGKKYSNPKLFSQIPENTITPLIADELAAANAILIGKHTKAGKFDQDGFDKAWASRKTELIEAKREKLKMQYLGYVSEEVNFSVVETSDADRVMQSRVLGAAGDTRGSFAGETARFVLQFSSFPMAFAHRVLGRAIYGTDNKLANAGHIGSVMSSMLIAGYMANLMIDISQGVTPAIPDEDNWTDLFYKSAVKSGFAGFYGDALLGALFETGGLGDLTGPEIGAVFKTMSSVGDIIKGDYQEGLGKIVDVALNHTPYQNLFYLRPVLDMAFLTELDSYVHPKRQKLKDAKLKNFNQERLVPTNLWE